MSSQCLRKGDEDSDCSAELFVCVINLMFYKVLLAYIHCGGDSL
jgi:hypothetical protein